MKLYPINAIQYQLSLQILCYVIIKQTAIHRNTDETDRQRKETDRQTRQTIHTDTVHTLRFSIGK